MNYYAFIFGAMTFISTLCGGLVAIKYSSKYGAISALSAGVLIAISLFDLLPESLKLAATLSIAAEYIMYSVAAGFIFILVVQRYFSIKRIRKGSEWRNVRNTRGGWFGTSAISVHSFIEGAAIGLSFNLNFHVGIIVAVAIIAHDFCDGINAVTVMLNSKNSRKSSLQMLFLVALAPLLGVTSTLLFTIPDRYLVLMIPFLVGIFLFLAASDCLPEAFEKNPPWVTVTFSFIGFIFIFAVVRVLNI
jgi:zinc transporter ZupT